MKTLPVVLSLQSSMDRNTFILVGGGGRDCGGGGGDDEECRRRTLLWLGNVKVKVELIDVVCRRFRDSF